MNLHPDHILAIWDVLCSFVNLSQNFMSGLIIYEICITYT